MSYSKDLSGIFEVFKCFICFSTVEDAVLLPCCSKLCCRSCIFRWLDSQPTHACPHCRATVYTHQLVSCRFAGEVSQELERVQKGSGDQCDEHNAPLFYYCSTCSEAVCSDCALFGSHTGHSFSHLSRVYEDHVHELRQACSQLTGSLSTLNSYDNSIEASLENLDRAKLEHCQLIKKLSGEALVSVEDQYRIMKSQLVKCGDEINTRSRLVSATREALESQISNLPRNQLISDSKSLVESIQTVKANSDAPIRFPEVSAEFANDIVPPFETARCVLPDYNKRRSGGSDEIFFSDIFISNGVTWRLKIYPNGNGAADKEFISAFVEMVDSNDAPFPAQYEYRVQLEGPNGMPNVQRDFVSEFVTSDSWGYNKFVKLSSIEEDGLLTPEGSLIFNFSIRPTTFAQLYRDQSRLLQSLHTSHNNALHRISEMEALLGSTNVEISTQTTASLAGSQKSQKENNEDDNAPTESKDKDTSSSVKKISSIIAQSQVEQPSSPSLMASVLYSESDEEICDSLSDASHSSRPKTPKASVEDSTPATPPKMPSKSSTPNSKPPKSSAHLTPQQPHRLAIQAEMANMLSQARPSFALNTHDTAEDLPITSSFTPLNQPSSPATQRPGSANADFDLKGRGIDRPISKRPNSADR